MGALREHGVGSLAGCQPLVYDAMRADSVSTNVLVVSVDRDLPSLEWRTNLLVASDVISGLLIACFGAFSLSKRTAWWAQWAAAAVGVWLLFAPLLFWSPSAAQYNNDLLVGALVISFAVFVPMMPGMSMAGMMDPKSFPLAGLIAHPRGHRGYPSPRWDSWV